MKFWTETCSSPSFWCRRSWSDEPELGDGVSTSTTSRAKHDVGGGPLQQLDVALAVQYVPAA